MTLDDFSRTYPLRYEPKKVPEDMAMRNHTVRGVTGRADRPRICLSVDKKRGKMSVI